MKGPTLLHEEAAIFAAMCEGLQSRGGWAKADEIPGSDDISGRPYLRQDLSAPGKSARGCSGGRQMRGAPSLVFPPRKQPVIGLFQREGVTTTEPEVSKASIVYHEPILEVTPVLLPGWEDCN